MVISTKATSELDGHTALLLVDQRQGRSMAEAGCGAPMEDLRSASTKSSALPKLERFLHFSMLLDDLVPRRQVSV